MGCFTKSKKYPKTNNNNNHILASAKNGVLFDTLPESAKPKPITANGKSILNGVPHDAFMKSYVLKNWALDIL
jgi:hypothetical protein